MKIIMIGVNILFFAMAATILGVGIWMAVEPGDLDALEVSEPMMDNELWEAAVGIFITVGVFLFGLAVVGLWSALAKNQSILMIFAGVGGLILIMELTAVILSGVYWDSMNEEEVLPRMLYGVKNLYVDENANDPVSEAWNLMQSEWECCGATGPGDYELSNYHNKTGFKVPPTCCNSYFVDQAQCQNIVSPYIYDQGCYQVMATYLNEKAPLIIGLCCGFGVLQIAGLVLGCISLIRKDD